ncbi:MULTISPECIES: hypothetical protein [unclassified Variovorax]|uniref:hypothetical protein n=1 Tax=unclassified Variovorax TaxID=663243 RepID=UPI001BD3422E|nr:MULTISPECIES: hypothetical protein [unclassified Variovorax]
MRATIGIFFKLAAIAVMLICGPVMAACNNPANWLESPKVGVKMLIGYQQSLSGTQFAGDPSSGQNFQPFAPPPPPEMLERSDGTLPANTEGWISYYELDSKGNWRICRQEKWRARDESTDPLKIAQTAKYQSGNASLRPLMQSHYFGSATVFLYDKVGRIQETFKVLPLPTETFDRQCFRYNVKNQLLLYVAANTRDVCPTGDPDLKDYWRAFRYADYKGEPVTVWAQQHYASKDGTWEDRIDFVGPLDDAQPYTGYAKVESGKGLVEILGGVRVGPKDQSDNTKYPYDSGKLPPIEYYFTKQPVPASVLTDMEQLYRHDRRRETDVLSGVKLVEFYPANVHVLRERFYTGFDRTIRQEKYDDQGRLKRVINLGFVGKYKNSGGFYDERLSGLVGLKVKTNKLHYRVWDYDDAGNPELVAIGWNTKLGSAMRNERLDDAEMAYGTPDGVVKWKTKEEFFKAFDFDAWAMRAYPELPSAPR